MRLALHPTTEAGHRAGRILLSEPDLEALGIYGNRSRGTEDRRSMAIPELTGFAVLISDDPPSPLDLAAIAVEDGLSCVLAADAAPSPSLTARFTSGGLTLLLGAHTAGLAEALRVHAALGAVAGPWGGALARVAGPKKSQRLVAVADDRRHLDGLALAAGALLVAGHGLAPGVWHPSHAADGYMQAAAHLGLEIAGFDAGP